MGDRHALRVYGNLGIGTPCAKVRRDRRAWVKMRGDRLTGGFKGGILRGVAQAGEVVGGFDAVAKDFACPFP